jgi:hypothetical protein
MYNYMFRHNRLHTWNIFSCPEYKKSQNSKLYFLAQWRFAVGLFLLVILPNVCDPPSVLPTVWNQYFCLVNPSAHPELSLVVVGVYATLVSPVLEFGAACWVPYREGQIHALDKVKKEAAKCEHHMNESIWETLSQRRNMSRVCALFKPYHTECQLKDIVVRLQGPN